MTGQFFGKAVLRQVSTNQSEASSLLHFLSPTSEVLIGRDPRCQIVLDSLTYAGVSRQHAKISLAPQAANQKTGQPGNWQICDLGSANGTYINGQRLQGCRALREGDRIVLGQNGAQFVFEHQATIGSPTADFPPIPQPVVSPAAYSATARSGQPRLGASPASDVTLSQLFPIVSTGRDLTRKAYLIPGSIIVCAVVLMFASIGNTILFNLLLALLLAGGAYYFIYQLCGKHKPWWLLVGAAILTMLLLVSPVLSAFIFVFRGVLPGNVPEDIETVSFPVLLIKMFFGAGLMEELLKAIPIFAAYAWGNRLRSPQRERIGVWEPLDGILLGAASAAGFTILETLGQYVPGIVNQMSIQSGAEVAEVYAIQLLIPRILGSVAGHMAYSGYFGYFIGLSILKPSKRWQILGVGYLTASGLHALWNATGVLNLLVLTLVGVMSYAFLAAAILKARTLSPTRSQNFATRFSRLP
jgi:RsiW-degrading membrane proteinase PrsW (M82 family)